VDREQIENEIGRLSAINTRLSNIIMGIQRISLDAMTLKSEIENTVSTLELTKVSEKANEKTKSSGRAVSAGRKQ